MCQNKFISLYDIVREYLPIEPAEDGNTQSVTDRKRFYASTFNSTLNALSINKDLRESLKDSIHKQYIFPNEPTIKNTVALLCIIPKNYPDNLHLEGHSRDDTIKNMGFIRNRDFSNVSLSFLVDFQKKIIELGKELIDDYVTFDMYETTIKESLRTSIYQQIESIKEIIQESCTYERLISSHTNGMVSLDDQTLYIKFVISTFYAIFDKIFDVAGEILEYMEEFRLQELEETVVENPELLDEYDFDFSEQFYTRSFRYNPDTIKMFSDEKQKEIDSIFKDISKQYDDSVQKKGNSSRQNSFKLYKKKLEKQLQSVDISETDIDAICNSVTFPNTITSPLKNGRTLWQKRTSHQLLCDAITQYQRLNKRDRFKFCVNSKNRHKICE